MNAFTCQKTGGAWNVRCTSKRALMVRFSVVRILLSVAGAGVLPLACAVPQARCDAEELDLVTVTLGTVWNADANPLHERFFNLLHRTRKTAARYEAPRLNIRTTPTVTYGQAPDLLSSPFFGDSAMLKLDLLKGWQAIYKLDALSLDATHLNHLYSRNGVGLEWQLGSNFVLNSRFEIATFPDDQSILPPFEPRESDIFTMLRFCF